MKNRKERHTHIRTHTHTRHLPTCTGHNRPLRVPVLHATLARCYVHTLGTARAQADTLGPIAAVFDEYVDIWAKAEVCVACVVCRVSCRVQCVVCRVSCVVCALPLLFIVPFSH